VRESSRARSRLAEAEAAEAEAEAEAAEATATVAAATATVAAATATVAADPVAEDGFEAASGSVLLRDSDKLLSKV